VHDEEPTNRTKTSARLALRAGRRRRLADPLAEALAGGALRLALAAGEVLGPADVGAVAAAHAQALEVVSLRQAVPRLRHRRRPHLCYNKGRGRG